MTRVLIFPAESEIGLEVAEATKYSKDIEVFGLTNNCYLPSNLIYKTYLYSKYSVFSPYLISDIWKLIEKFEIDVLYPTHDRVIDFYISFYKELNLRCRVVSHPLNTLFTCRNKRTTYDLFPEISPKVYKTDNLKFPLLSKPVFGFGSQGIKLVGSKEDYINRGDYHIDVEYLPGREYTVDCFCNNDNNLLYVQPRQRTRIKNGIAVEGKQVDLPEAEKIAELISNKLKFTGAWFFQIKEDKNENLKLLEIGSRIAGSSGVNRLNGVNLPLLSIYSALGKEVTISRNNGKGSFCRTLYSRFDSPTKVYSKVVVDLDDTLIVKGKVNIELLSFLYQCQNQNKLIYLITKNPLVMDELEYFAISGKLFQEILYCQDKPKAIENLGIKDFIFIDDSFSERESIRTKFQASVFDVNDVALLLENRY